ncbi:MAG TPA: circadian clock protein KaiC [Candidatus Competibacter sp.]|nr:circadian clock protein KaiC [Candidatus Competibacteraceae bacterium]HPE72242.1 circadian clock protein KaiC [Candidatus Competibacter sp.]HRW67016.1 circadian clock protein KaiC [Candidatus Competibacter sp.]
MNQQGIAKAPTGIEGLDNLTSGGLPRHRVTLLAGSAGAGKTVLSLQILVNGVERWNEPAIFVAFEENSRQIIENAATFGWDLAELERQKLFFLDAQMRPDVVKTGEFDLGGVLAVLQAKADAMGARRIVFDALDVLLALLDDPLAERRELYRLHDWLMKNRLTGIITSKLDADDASLMRRHSTLQFMMDCVAELHHQHTDGISSRWLRMVKYRGSAFDPHDATLVMGQHGIEIFHQGPPSINPIASSERLSSGVERLDTMLGGGYFRGAAVLLSGAPGTTKTTLCGAFAEAACRRNERVLYVGFDESPAEITRNLRSVGIDLTPHLDSGLLRMHAAGARRMHAVEHLLDIRNLMRAHQPDCLMIDPLSAVIKDGRGIHHRVPERLLQLIKPAGITLLCTSLIEGNDPYAEASTVQVSTVADTWIHLSYAIRAGERNRALTIVKLRGSAHSKQVRELILSDRGITLAKTYLAGGEVLMGTARWQRELAEQAEQARIQAEVDRKHQEIELAQAELNIQMEVLRQKLHTKQVELDTLLATEATRQRLLEANRAVLAHKRDAEGDTDGSAETLGDLPAGPGENDGRGDQP